MLTKPRISIAVPFHWMENWQFFLTRCLESIESQTFKDYEIVLIKHSTMPVTSNRSIESCKGEIIKVLYMDDFLAHENALQNLVDGWKGGWMATGCNHNGEAPHIPYFVGVLNNRNTIGSPSVVAFENDSPLLFDEKMSWMLDVDLYKRLWVRYGKPTLLDSIDVTIGIHKAQMTNILTPQEKQDEYDYLITKNNI